MSRDRLVGSLMCAMIGCGGGSSGGGGGGGGDDTAGPDAGGSPVPGQLVTYGSAYTDGQFNLGPVDYAESQFHNACAPSTKYPPAIQQLEGVYLAGLWNGIPNVANYCDACIYVTTAMGKSALLRVVTYGDTSTDSIDVSPEAYAVLDSGEYPRTMSWQFAECNDTGPIVYDFQTESSQYWTSLWVRNARVPLTSVSVQSANHSAFTALDRGGDGTLTDSGGFGSGAFTFQLAGLDGSSLTQAFPWPTDNTTAATLEGSNNFP